MNKILKLIKKQLLLSSPLLDLDFEVEVDLLESIVLLAPELVFVSSFFES